MSWCARLPWFRAFFWRDVALRAGASFSSGVRQSGGRGGTKPRRGGGIPSSPGRVRGIGLNAKSRGWSAPPLRRSEAPVYLPPPRTRGPTLPLALKNTARHGTAKHDSTTSRPHGATVRCRACETASTVSHGPVHVFCRCFRKTHKSTTKATTTAHTGTKGHVGGCCPC